MDDDARERLAERVALNVVNRRRARFLLAPITDMQTVSEPQRSMLTEDARAALAVIEPAVREECIAIANRWSRDGQSATAHGIIEGIREAGMT